MVYSFFIVLRILSHHTENTEVCAFVDKNLNYAETVIAMRNASEADLIECVSVRQKEAFEAVVNNVKVVHKKQIVNRDWLKASYSHSCFDDLVCQAALYVGNLSDIEKTKIAKTSNTLIKRCHHIIGLKLDNASLDRKNDDLNQILSVYNKARNRYSSTQLSTAEQWMIPILLGCVAQADITASKLLSSLDNGYFERVFSQDENVLALEIFLVAQHADRRPSEQVRIAYTLGFPECTKYFEKAKKYCAYISDRVGLKLENTQYYGTQLDCSNELKLKGKKLNLVAIEQNRERIGLDSLKNYISICNS